VFDPVLDQDLLEGVFVLTAEYTSPPHSCRRTVAWAALAMIVALSWTTRCRADDPPPEYAVKAAFIYNFTQFITWPDDAFASTDAPFVIATVGGDPFAGALEKAMEGKTVGNRPIVVKHFADADDIGPCQVLFVPAAADADLAADLSKVGKNPILTVGESQAFLDSGGCIRFFIEDNRMRFAIDPDVAAAARLKIAARLMQLAKIYKKNG
jgi:preprotein translocase subunit Sec61beta